MTRKILKITGNDREHFLQGLVTNDVRRLSDGPVYAAILTPQGKFMADFFLVAQGDAILMDVDADLAGPLLPRLMMYKLRADVEIAETDLYAHRGIGDTPPDGHADPRHPAMGWRAYRDTAPDPDTTDWDAIRVAHCIPKAGQELTPDSYVLEAGFERLNGIDFRKGCFVGQEVAARMKHKTELKKGLVPVTLGGPVEPGTPLDNNGRDAGRIHTVSGDRAIAYLRFDRAGPDLMAEGVTVRWDGTKP